MKLWSGRFTKETEKIVDELNASLPFDNRLFREDIVGSAAHVKMLGDTGIISTEESATLLCGLSKILERFERGDVSLSVSDEDIHMLVERLLHEEVGAVAGKLHTARSRNDQVALDMHLFLRKTTIEIIELLLSLQKALITKAYKEKDVIFPGYTHLQRAQPILFSHHLLAYAWMFQRDIERLKESYKRVNVSPLGAGALAGTTFPIDRHQTARLLNFDSIYPNSLDAVSNRDFVVECISHCSMLMMHLSRLSEEIILWSSTEFGFIELDDAFSTGSSIMPQKKNPDIAELARGKTGRVYGSLLGILTTLKALPLTYNKDLQEDKEGLFDTVSTVTKLLSIYPKMIETMTIRREVMAGAVRRDFSNATDLADYLAKKGMPFREAHGVAGRLVLHCINRGCYLLDLPLEEYRDLCQLIEEDVYHALSPETIVARRRSGGGTAPEEVLRQFELLATHGEETKSWIESRNVERLGEILT